jgi:transmembrane sensor
LSDVAPSQGLDAIAPRHIRAQAAVWVTDLHGPHRDAKLEARVRRWIAADPRHAAAFELATDAWQRSGNLPAHHPPLEAIPPFSAIRALPRGIRASRVPRPVLAGSAVLCAALLATFYLLNDATLATGSAERRTVDLSDGTQVTLNANTRLVVRYDRGVRSVTLAKGEALFTVAKHQPRPFVVLIGTRKIIALGTAFEVRREASDFSVTLIEGRIAVEPLAWPDALPQNPAPGLTLLRPGERLRVTTGAPDRLDLPAVERVTAWQKGQLIFDDASLREAAHEFNRYGTHRLTIEANVPDTYRVGGVFRIGDPDSFAQAMSNAYPLRITHRGEDIILGAR